MQNLLGFILAGVALAGSPGPNTLSLAATGAAFGARRGIWYLVGLTVGMVVVMAIVAAGVMSVAMAIPGAAVAALVLSALYFAYLAFKIATAPPLSGQVGQAKPPSFFGGVLLSLVNPKGYAAMAALFAGFALSSDATHDAIAKIAVLTVVILAVNVGWLIAGSALTRYFRNPRTNRIINIVFAVLLIVSLVPAIVM